MTKSHEVGRQDGSARERKRLTSLRVLVVEDDADTRDLTVFGLERAGASAVVGVSTFAEADAMLDAESFDVVVSDIVVEHGATTGIEFARRARATRRPCPALVGISGRGKAMDIVDGLEAGFGAYLVKPLTLTSLVEAIARLVEETRRA